MGKQTGKKKLKSVVLKVKQQQQQNKALDQGGSPKSSSYDKDTAVFISMSLEHKEEGNRLFQKKDYEGAILKYEKAINLLPRNHIDVSSLHSNIAACYMHMGLSDYPRAIQECNKALEVTPKYSKALLKRARCYEALNRLDLALRDVHIVLNLEPKNLTATEIEQRIKMVVEERGGTMSDIDVNSIPVPEYVDITPCACSFVHRLKEKAGKKNKSKDEKKIEQEVEDNVEEKKNDERVEEKKKSNEDKKNVELKSEDRVEETNGYEEAEEAEVNNNAVEMKLNQHSEYNAEENESSVHVEEEKFSQENEGRVEEYESDYYLEEMKKKSSNVVQKSKDSVDEDDRDEYLDVEKKKRNKAHEKKRSEDRINEEEYYERVKEKRSRRKHDEKNNDEQVEEKRKSNKLGKKFKQKLEDRIEGKKKKVEVEEKKKISKVGKKFKQKIEDRIEGKKNDVRREDIANVKIEKSYEEKCEEKKAEDKLVVEEKKSTNSVEDEPKMNVKLVFGEDIRWAKIPVNCNVLKLREVIFHRYPSAKAFLVKYRDQEGDMVTITTNEELRWAEANVEPLGSFKLYIAEVTPEQDPFLGQVKSLGHIEKKVDVNAQICIDDWLIQFAQLFKNYVGFSSDAYLDLHEIGMKLYSEAMEDTVTSEDAQDLFNAAADKFHEMSALALFNCGNVHMSTARKRIYFTEDDSSRGSILEQVKASYDWAQEEYFKAGERYQQALIIKPDFYEGYLALGKQQFEMAKLSWYFAVGTNVDLETWNSTEVFQLYNNAEDNMEKGMQMWEEAEKQRKKEALRPSKVKLLLQKMDLDKAIKDITAAEAAEQARNMRSQINLLWGSMLYERSIMEYKLGIPVWHECLEVSVEKFEVAGASPTDIAVMIKNHCSNDNALEGLGFNIDEIVEAWNEMYDAKRWQRGVPSFRLEPLLRRRVSKLYHALERA